jgi:hypothetical protein
MEGKLPEIYWYVFWVGFVIISFGAMTFGGILAHRARLRELDILKSYAEKGIEPPPAVLEALAGPERQRKTAAKAEGVQAGVGAGVHLGQFVGSMFAAGLTGGVAWWAAEGRAPEWLFYGAVIVTIACVAGAVARLVAVIATREK